MSVVIRLKVPIEMHCTVIPMGTSKVNSSPKLLNIRTRIFNGLDATYASIESMSMIECGRLS